MEVRATHLQQLLRTQPKATHKNKRRQRSAVRARVAQRVTVKAVIPDLVDLMDRAGPGDNQMAVVEEANRRARDSNHKYLRYHAPKISLIKGSAFVRALFVLVKK